MPASGSQSGLGVVTDHTALTSVTEARVRTSAPPTWAGSGSQASAPSSRTSSHSSGSPKDGQLANGESSWIEDLTGPLEEVRSWAACISQSIQNGVAALAEELSLWSGDSTRQDSDGATPPSFEGQDSDPAASAKRTASSDSMLQMYSGHDLLMQSEPSPHLAKKDK